MINTIRWIPTTETSYPFVSANRRCNLAENGYEEKEYFLYGTANVYESVDQRQVRVRSEDAPYVNRLVVRAPIDPAMASGRVVVEIINPTSGMEIERMWILVRHHLMRRGDIYVGITSKPNTIAVLKQFDPVRYAELAWPNPTIDVPLPAEGAFFGLRDYDQSYEPGLFWDMLTDLAHLLRDGGGKSPISGYMCKNLILTAWSQSASYMTRYLNSFAYRPEVRRGGCVFDGYLSCGAPRQYPVPVNQYETYTVKDSQGNRVSYCEQPYLVVQTESENAEFHAYLTGKFDSDSPNFLYRVYEIAGASHESVYSYLDYYGNDPDLIRLHCLPAYRGKHKQPNRYPYQYPIAACFEHLYRWIETGIAPAHVERIKTDAMGHNVRDALGNAIGGVRTCLLDYPTCAYDYSSVVEKGQFFVDPDSERDILFGHEEAFPPAMLCHMYGNLENYRRLVEQSTREHVTKGYILREDAAALVELAVTYARERGLESDAALSKETNFVTKIVQTRQ